MEQRPGGQTTSAVARAGQLAISMAVTARARLEELAPKAKESRIYPAWLLPSWEGF